jgi:hypothetical protein
MDEEKSTETAHRHPSWIGAWTPKHPPKPAPKRGDYVVATKYADGDPGDHFCIGFYQDNYDHYGQTRHIVIDGEGKPFRGNGFRRVACIGAKRGAWMVEHLAHIARMKDRFSVWHWVRAPWHELDQI